MNNIDMLTTIQQNLFSQGIDATITFKGTQVELELTDMSTESVIGVTKGDSLEEAYATLLGRFAGQSRDIKTGRVKPSLTEL